MVLSQLAASPGSGVARLMFFGPPTTLLRAKWTEIIKQAGGHMAPSAPFDAAPLFMQGGRTVTLGMA